MARTALRGARRALTAPARGYRTLTRRHRRHPTPAKGPLDLDLAPAQHPYGRILGLAAVTVLGGWLGLLVVGTLHAPVGPMDTRMSLRPSFSGDTQVQVPPLGSLRLDSHDGPLGLNVDVDTLDPERAQDLVKHPERISGLQEEVARDVSRSTLELALRSSAAVLAGASALGLVVYRRPRRALAAGGLALALLAASGAGAYATWNPESVLEPKFSGLLSSAPSVVGNARSIVSDFDVYQQELARLVTNMAKLYNVTSTLPVYSPDPSTLRVLHVSDIHLNPAAWEIIRSVVTQYKIDVIIDTGDLMDHGTAAENGFTSAIPTLGAPYVFVRGNHDSLTSQASVASREGAYVVDDGASVTVKGVTIAGTGDPQFTADRSVVASGDPAERAAGQRLAAAIRQEESTAGGKKGREVDIAVAHNPVAVTEADGLAPLLLAGHLHHREESVLDGGSRLMIQGSTGGGGLRAVEGDKPQDIQASVLYLDRDTRALQAWDEITLGGLGLSKAEVSRHLPEKGRSD